MNQTERKQGSGEMPGPSALSVIPEAPHSILIGRKVYGQSSF
jgi:hypothetical protein